MGCGAAEVSQMIVNGVKSGFCLFRLFSNFILLPPPPGMLHALSDGADGAVPSALKEIFAFVETTAEKMNSKSGQNLIYYIVIC